ncbi:hypothetical protein [Pseudoalteromonas sp. T1lg88]|uniref:hypothetical protein n=1 Tax=Pseudoalteromonas sp. T1lg88 TaxID=2077104 RepID=UPI000CF6E4BE|nr:hypothetical protein [Pseudoalteromonas sp. T1lg88]
MHYWSIFLIIVATAFTAQANEKKLNKCISPSGKVAYTTEPCPAGHREQVVREQMSLMQFAQKARQAPDVGPKEADETDLAFYLRSNFTHTDWVENIQRSYLEQGNAVVVVNTFRLHKLEGICQATQQWIQEHPHPIFNLQDMRFVFTSGAPFESRYVTQGVCDYRLR